MVLLVELRNDATPEDLGLIPGMLDDADPRPAREQLDANYQHGGGWRPFNGYTLHQDDGLTYPGDPTFYPRAVMYVRDERVVLYDHAIVAIIQPDRSFEACRMD